METPHIVSISGNKSSSPTEQQRLTPQRKQVQTMAMAVKCPSCGHDNREEANYCMKCGLRIVVPPLYSAPETAAAEYPPAMQGPRPLGCSFHPHANASYLCGRCGRALCGLCARPSFGIVLCPLCSTGPVQPYPWVQSPVIRPPYPLTMPQFRFG
jgi:ribosomal protein L32